MSKTVGDVAKKRIVPKMKGSQVDDPFGWNGEEANNCLVSAFATKSTIQP